jgi:multidrug transporter EmrE-like cation transporter
MKAGWAVDSRSAVLIALVLLGLVGSQICVKAGLARSGGVVLSSGEGIRSVLRLLRQPLLWAGFALTGFAAVVWFEVLSRLSLSVAYPFLSLSYVIMLFAAHWFLRDPITWPRVLGALLVCAGVLLMGRRA